MLKFVGNMLLDISAAWQRANVDGLKYSPEKGILNSNNDGVFNQLKDFVTGKVELARPERFELPTFWFVGKNQLQPHTSASNRSL